jgi:hypothetical protein
VVVVVLVVDGGRSWWGMQRRRVVDVVLVVATAVPYSTCSSAAGARSLERDGDAAPVPVMISDSALPLLQPERPTIRRTIAVTSGVRWRRTGLADRLPRRPVTTPPSPCVRERLETLRVAVVNVTELIDVLARDGEGGRVRGGLVHGELHPGALDGHAGRDGDAPEAYADV